MHNYRSVSSVTCNFTGKTNPSLYLFVHVHSKTHTSTVLSQQLKKKTSSKLTFYWPRIFNQLNTLFLV